MPRGGAPGRGLARGSNSQLVPRQRSVWTECGGRRKKARSGGTRLACSSVIARWQHAACAAVAQIGRLAVATEAHTCTEKRECVRRLLGACAAQLCRRLHNARQVAHQAPPESSRGVDDTV